MKARIWLNQNYPKKERSKVEEIHLNEPSLERELDLRDFTFEFIFSRELKIGVKVYVYPVININKLVIKNQGKNVEIIPIDAQKYIDYYYPNKKERKQVKELQISFKKLEGNLDLSDFVNLKELYCDDNELTTLNLSNCNQLEQIYCEDNLLTNLTLPNNLINLKYLYLRNNNFPERDLSFLTGATNLISLALGNWDEDKIQSGIYNRWTGSLEYLSNMKKLNSLIIENTDISIGLEHLPNSLRGFFCSVEYRPEAGVKNIEQELRKYGKPDESHLNNYVKLLTIWRTNNQTLEQLAS